MGGTGAAALLGGLGAASMWGFFGAWLIAVMPGLRRAGPQVAVTLSRNLPLNDRLEGAGVADAAAWSAYVGRRVAWNHVRTLASGLCLVGLVAGLQGWGEG